VPDPPPHHTDVPPRDRSARPAPTPTQRRPAKAAAKSAAKAAATAAATALGRALGGAAAGTAGDGAAAGRGASVGRAYDHLRELIVRGRLAPGSRIVESEIAERLHVSRTPARSALHRLRQEGYVAALDRASEQRLIVAPLTQEDGRELFQLVGQIESLAARMCADLAPPARSALARRLRQINRDLAQAARPPQPDPPRIFDLDAAFHRAYVEGAAGPRLLALHDAIKPQAERYARLYTSALVDEIATSVNEHAEIVRRVEAGDAAGAQQAVETNWRNAAERLARVIGALGERGNW
jgi:DNA-binding GntR family transcriptional regulator